MLEGIFWLDTAHVWKYFSAHLGDVRNIQFYFSHIGKRVLLEMWTNQKQKQVDKVWLSLFMSIPLYPKVFEEYLNNAKYWDRQASVNCVEPDQTMQTDIWLA